MKRLIAAAAGVWGVIALVGWGVLAQEKKDDIPVITVSGEKQVVPIAIPAAQPLGGSRDPRDFKGQVRRAVAYDLAVSGFFKVLPPKSYLAKRTEGIEASTINFEDWFNTGAQLVVKTGFTLAGSSVRLEGRLYEVSQRKGRQVLSRSFKGDASEIRHLSHLWANAIVKYFTNEDGIFTTKIAYSRRVRVSGELAKNIYVVDFDGRGRRALTRNTALNLLPRWSPAGNALLASTTVNRKWEVVRISLGSGRMRVISSRRGLNVGGVYSPSGTRIALTLSKDGNSEVYLLTASGKIVRRLTDNWAIDSSPAFSPDGRKIAFVSDRSGSPQIYVMNSNGSGQRRLTFRGNYNQEPDWSPKGDKIVFTGRDRRSRFDLFTVAVSGGSISRLTQGSGHNEHAKWSPDGRHLVFASSRRGGSSIWLMWADGTNQRILGGAGRSAYTPAWSPRLK